MLLPGRLEKCKRFFNDLDPNFFPNIEGLRSGQLIYSIAPLIDKGETVEWRTENNDGRKTVEWRTENNDGRTYKYSEEELRYIRGEYI
jgi:hypothetical protein